MSLVSRHEPGISREWGFVPDLERRAGHLDFRCQMGAKGMGWEFQECQGFG